MTFKDKEKEIIEYIEKPKLTRKERDFLEMLEDDIYIAKDEYGGTSLFSDEPLRCSSTWYVAIHECEDDECGILLNDGAFPFITWESGKAWSKSELMELEVMELELITKEKDQNIVTKENID